MVGFVGEWVWGAGGSRALVALVALVGVLSAGGVGAWRSGVGVGVVAGAVPGHAGGGARAARGAAGRRAARAHHRLLRLHARGPRAQPLQQGRRGARQRAAHDAARLDLLLLFGTRLHVHTAADGRLTYFYNYQTPITPSDLYQHSSSTKLLLNLLWQLLVTCNINKYHPFIIPVQHTKLTESTKL